MTTSDRDLIPAVTRLVADIEKRDSETAEMKRTVNKLCGYAGLPIRYPQVDKETNAGGAYNVHIKPGQFFNKPLSTAVREYLEQRGDPAKNGLGPATLDEVYDALGVGGFVFDAKSDRTAKRALSISLAKNTAAFQKLPTGEIGLAIWFRNARQEH